MLNDVCYCIGMLMCVFVVCCVSCMLFCLCCICLVCMLSCCVVLQLCALEVNCVRRSASNSARLCNDIMIMIH